MAGFGDQWPADPNSTATVDGSPVIVDCAVVVFPATANATYSNPHIELCPASSILAPVEHPSDSGTGGIFVLLGS